MQICITHWPSSSCNTQTARHKMTVATAMFLWKIWNRVDYQGISCVWLMGFFSGYSGFPVHPLGCLELDFCSSFSKVRLNLRCVVYLCIFHGLFIILFPPASFPTPTFFFSSFLFFFWRILFIASYSLRHTLFFFTSGSFVPFSFCQLPSIKLIQDKLV